MKKFIFMMLAMLYCPSLFAATLTPNTVPYVCQGGTTPQLCNSNITTDSNGNANLGFGTWQSYSLNTIYHASTNGLVVFYGNGYDGNAVVILQGITDSSPSPTTVRESYHLVPGPNNNFFNMVMPVWSCGIVLFVLLTGLLVSRGGRLVMRHRPFRAPDEFNR